MQSKALIIVGMHRSGTSLITNWLNRCGLQVGECLLGEGPGNVEGHFEDVEFLKIHEEILESNGLPITGLVDDNKIAVSVYQLEKLKAVINVKHRLYKQWGWKEPRTCLFLSAYRKLLPQAKYLIILRDYQAVINSLLKREFEYIDKRYMSRIFIQRWMWVSFKREQRRQKFYRDNAAYYLKVWINYNQQVLDMLKELPADDYKVVNYSLLEKSGKQVFSFLTDIWGFNLKYVPFNKVYKQGLISNCIDVNALIKDDVLLSKARGIENKFKKYIDSGLMDAIAV